MVSTFVGIALLNIWGSPRMVMQDAQSEEAPKKPMLMRVYKAGDKQDYKFSIKVNTPEGDLNINGGYVDEVKKVLEGGFAEIESKTTEMKMTFGGAESPSGDMPPAVTYKFDKHGMPLDMKPEDLDSLSVPVMIAQYLPAIEVTNPGTFKIDYKGNDFTVEGEGKLIATGRIYEERVAKIEYQFTVSPNNDAPGKFTITSYLNLFTGKLVKIEGTGKIDDPDAGTMNVTYAVDKVRG